MSAIGSLHFALAANNVVTHFNNTDINVQTNTNQKQECDTAGGRLWNHKLMHSNFHGHGYSKR